MILVIFSLAAIANLLTFIFYLINHSYGWAAFTGIAFLCCCDIIGRELHKNDRH